MKPLGPALLLLFAGCAGTPVRVSLDPPTQQLRPDQYVDELKLWTRHGHLQDEFDVALEVDATFRAPEFRAAYAEKWISLFRIGPGEAARTRDELMADGADTWEFHAESAMHYFELNDLTSRKTIWRVTLVDDQGREVTPREVIATKMRRELEAEFYPYAGLFSKGWRIRFPRTLASGQPLVTPDTKSLTLRIAGPRGSVDLVWVLRRSGPST
jgi:hypothetical protein